MFSMTMTEKNSLSQPCELPKYQNVYLADTFHKISSTTANVANSVCKAKHLLVYFSAEGFSFLVLRDIKLIY